MLLAHFYRVVDAPMAEARTSRSRLAASQSSLSHAAGVRVDPVAQDILLLPTECCSIRLYLTSSLTTYQLASIRLFAYPLHHVYSPRCTPADCLAPMHRQMRRHIPQRGSWATIAWQSHGTLLLSAHAYCAAHTPSSGGSHAQPTVGVHIR